MESSPALGNLSQALAKAQGSFKSAPFDKTNPHFKNKYASLTSVAESVREAMAKNGLSINQPLTTHDGKLWLETVLRHESGEWVSSAFELIVDKPTMQGLGSAVTYARRYALSAMLGIVSDEDDDGNEAETHGYKQGQWPKAPPQAKTYASAPPPSQKPSVKPQEPVKPKPNDPAKSRIAQLMKEKHVSAHDLQSYVRAAYGAASSQDLTPDQMHSVTSMLEMQSSEEIQMLISSAIESIDAFLNMPDPGEL